MEPQDSGQPVQEQLIAQWEQPARQGMLASRGGMSKLWLIGIIIAVALIGIAIWQREVNLGLAGGVVLLAVISLQTQRKASLLPVTVTTMRIIVGKRDYPYAGLSGFWLADEGDVVEVNLENSKPGFIPMSFLYATPSLDEARAILGQVLPELQPREKKLGDKVSNYFKL